MTDQQKISLMDRLIDDILSSNEKGMVTRLQMIGRLTVKQGINGFKKAEVGTPVFIKADRYIIFMETLDGKTCVEIPYHLETLSLVIEKI